MPLPKKPTVYYDPECEKLAEHFLSDDRLAHTAVHEERIHSLAQAIQQAVETWCESNSEMSAVQGFESP